LRTKEKHDLVVQASRPVMSLRAADLDSRLTACMVFSSGPRDSIVVPVIAAANSVLNRSLLAW
jgi:hypothetical protein